MKLPDLPTYYYRDHFLELLSFVEATYSAVLEPTHLGFIGKFRALPKDEQCLFVRMVNRRGRIFDARTFKYTEINDLPPALVNLHQGYLRGLRDSDYAAWLPILKKDTLLSMAKAAGKAEVRASWSKLKLVGWRATE